jgi:hypothetical protein
VSFGGKKFEKGEEKKCKMGKKKERNQKTKGIYIA